MRWNFGGNLQPVQMICEYDWKQCPTAVVSYIWSEIVTDVVDSITEETQFWHILATMLLCSILLHTVYYKKKWTNESDHDFTKSYLMKVVSEIKDLELKINILTYKMQYGIWPLPHEILTPNSIEPPDIELTLSNTNRQDMWTKHNLHGYTSKYIRNSENNKSIHKLLPTSEGMNLADQNFSPQFGNRNNAFDEMLKSQRNLKLFHKESNCKHYKKLIKTARECRKYMDEINESNKSLRLFGNSSDISVHDSAMDMSTGTELEQNSHGFLVNQNKWHNIYKYENNETKRLSKSDLTASNQMFSMSKSKYKDSIFSSDDERYLLKSSNTSRPLPPGLSITFLSDKFKTLTSNNEYVAAFDKKQSGNKTSPNETFNPVKEEMENLRGIKQPIKNSRSLNNVAGYLENNNNVDLAVAIKTSSKINLMNHDKKYEKEEQYNMKKLDKLILGEWDSSSRGDNGTTLDSTPIKVFTEKIPAEQSHLNNTHKEFDIYKLNEDVNSMLETMNNSAGDIAKLENAIDHNACPDITSNHKHKHTNLNDVKMKHQDFWNVSDEMRENLIVLPLKKLSTRCNVVKNLSQIAWRKEDLSIENDSNTSFEINSTSRQKIHLDEPRYLCEHRPYSSNTAKLHQPFDLNKNAIENMVNMGNDRKSPENNINSYFNNELKNIPSMSYVLLPQDQSIYRMPMETEEDTTAISQTSSQTELSNDSDTDDKSTTTLLQEALEFKKVLLMQIHKEDGMRENGHIRNESSECESDNTSRSKEDNCFQSQLLDIITEEHSAGSSTEKTSRTYILSRSNNKTNFCKDPDKYLKRNNNVEDIKCDEVTLEDEYCRSLKNPLTASSSEYFSANNVIDNEHTSAQKVNQFVADGDGFNYLEESGFGKCLDGELELNVRTNHENNIIAQGLIEELQNSDEKEKNTLPRNKFNAITLTVSQDVLMDQTTIPSATYTQRPQENNIENLMLLAKLEKIVKNVEDIDNMGASIKESCENTLKEVKKQTDSVAESIVNKSEAKVEFCKNFNVMDSLKGISWNSIGESSCNESIMQFVNTLTNSESKNIHSIAELKLMMLNSKDYGGRNYATAGKGLRNDDNLYNRKQPSVVLLSDINISEQSNNVTEDILEMIVDSAAFKLERPQMKELNTSTNNTSADDLSNESNSFKLQTKQNIFSKLKTLDALAKPLDISEYTGEKYEHKEDANPLTGHIVVCVQKSNTRNITFNETKGDDSKNKNNSCIKSPVSLILKNNDYNTTEFQSENAEAMSEDFIGNTYEVVRSNTIVDVPTNENELSQVTSQLLASENELNDSENLETIGATKSNFTTTRILSTHHTKSDLNLGSGENKLDAKNTCDSNVKHRFKKSKCNTNSQNEDILNKKKNQMSISSMTNFSTDTSESYFDVSNHDFAVSSIILTQQNSQFASNQRDDNMGSDASSSYIDASDHCCKTPRNSSSTIAKAMSNLTDEKTCLSESQTVNVDDNKMPGIKTADTGILVKDYAVQNNLDSKNETLKQIQLRPKCTSSLPCNNNKSQFRAQEQAENKDQLQVTSSISCNHDVSEYWSSPKVEKSNSKSKAISKSCIPILKSRIRIPREKSKEAKTRSRSPVRRSDTPAAQSAESNYQIKSGGGNYENERKVTQSTLGSRRSLNGKHSDILLCKNSNTKQKYQNPKPGSAENEKCKIVRSISSDLATKPEKHDSLDTLGQLPRECTVIYINIISDSDHNETRAIDTKEIIEYVNQNELISDSAKLGLKYQSLSLRNIKSDRSDERKYEKSVISPMSDSKLCKTSCNCIINANEKASSSTTSSLEVEMGNSTDVNNSEKIPLLPGSIIMTANKLLSTSTLQLSNSFKVEHREIEVSAKPSVKNTSTSVSDFSYISPEQKSSFYNLKNEVFDVPKNLIQTEQIVLSEMLTTDPNFFECRKTHKFYNKLGLGFQEQAEPL